MENTRNPAVAGMFYYRDPKILEDQLRDFFSKAKEKEKNTAVISPHAGYEYSGRTAAFAIASLRKADSFVILGPNHTGAGAEFSVFPGGVWKTPLGDCRVDFELAEELKKQCDFLKDDASAHSQEHSIEVQLPLLQHMFGKFRFLPISIMNAGYEQSLLEKCEKLGEVIAGIAKKRKIGIIASSDFSHYLPLETANAKDRNAVQKIKKLDTRGFFETLQKSNASICGYGPIAAVMSAAKRLMLKPEIIDKSSSGDVTGDFGSVVTYYAIGFG